MKRFLVFGTHPRLSLAEFRAVRTGIAPPTVCGPAVVVDDPAWDGAVLMQRLGGTVKLGDVFLDLPRDEVTADDIADLIRSKPRGKKTIFGFSVFGGAPAARKRLEKLALGVKRSLSKEGASVRWVTSDDGAALSPAAVAKLHLTTDGYDVALLVHGDRVSVGLTTHVQDADAWSLRDYGRPVRDDENGMLPPKLARIMANLAQTPDGGTILDPFCGSGTVLMEAALATDAQEIIGSDISAEQVASTATNLEWCVAKRILNADDMKRFKVFQADVRGISKHVKTGSVDRIVTEGYLGPPLTGHETLETLRRNEKEISDLWRDALAAFRPLLKDDGRIVCVWPSFKSSHGTARVDLSDDPSVAERYEIIDPLGDWDTSRDPLLYHRPNQRVMRRIVVLEPKDA